MSTGVSPIKNGIPKKTAQAKLGAFSEITLTEAHPHITPADPGQEMCAHLMRRHRMPGSGPQIIDAES
jgi:hypothetical protein